MTQAIFGDSQKTISTNHLNLTFCLLVFFSFFFFYVYRVLNYLIFHSLYIVHIDLFVFFSLFTLYWVKEGFSRKKHC